MALMHPNIMALMPFKTYEQLKKKSCDLWQLAGIQSSDTTIWGDEHPFASFLGVSRRLPWF
jgi:hypothetical protein